MLFLEAILLPLPLTLPLTCNLFVIGKFLVANCLQVKTHLQAQANAEIAVGHQHEHTGGMAGALRTIFVNHGLSGLWRGVSGAVIRVSVGSATQLATFSWTKEQIVMLEVHRIYRYILESVCRNCRFVIRPLRR